MSKSLLKGIAVTFGAGLAFGIGAKLGRSTAPRRGNILDLDPLVDRIDGIEDRIHLVETRHAERRAAPLAEGEAPAETGALDRNLSEMDSRLSAQTMQLDSLRKEIKAVESRSAAQVTSFTQKLNAVEARLPSDIEAHVAERIAALEERLQADFRQTHSRTVDMFVQTIESKVVQRITALEQSLAEHSQSIVSLREKSLSTDENLQRLLAAVEKLCAQTATRAEPPSKPPAPGAGAPAENAPAGFSSHLEREMGRAGAPPHPPSAALQRAGVSLAFGALAMALGWFGIHISR